MYISMCLIWPLIFIWPLFYTDIKFMMYSLCLFRELICIDSVVPLWRIMPPQTIVFVCMTLYSCDIAASGGFLYASHFCYLMAQQPFGHYGSKTAKLVLIGSSPRWKYASKWYYHNLVHGYGIQSYHFKGLVTHIIVIGKRIIYVS